MARPIKKGLDYFPLDVDFFEDDKIELINAEFGVKGENIALRLLCLIYKNGYWYKMGEDESLLLAKRVGNGITSALVTEVVKGLVKRSFFDERVFNSFRILTSKGIQTRFFEAVERRKSVEIIPEIMLIDINEVAKDINVNINPINANINPQSKGKESKEKKSKEENSGGAPQSPAPENENLKKAYKALTKDKNSLFNFLKNEQPDFIEPYVDYWNLFAVEKSLPQVETITDSRKKKFKVRVAETAFDFTKIIQKASRSEFLLTSGSWFTFDWVFENQSNYVKVLEGNYDNNSQTQKNGHSKTNWQNSPHRPVITGAAQGAGQL